jgi:hypothetical protein
MTPNAMRLLNSWLAESASAGECPEHELLDRIEAADRKAMREFYPLFHRRLVLSDADDAPLRPSQ